MFLFEIEVGLYKEVFLNVLNIFQKLLRFYPYAHKRDRLL